MSGRLGWIRIVLVVRCNRYFLSWLFGLSIFSFYMYGFVILCSDLCYVWVSCHTAVVVYCWWLSACVVLVCFIVVGAAACFCSVGRYRLKCALFVVSWPWLAMLSFPSVPVRYVYMQWDCCLGALGLGLLFQISYLSPNSAGSMLYKYLRWHFWCTLHALMLFCICFIGCMVA